jgi:hypothetical protein
MYLSPEGGFVDPKIPELILVFWHWKSICPPGVVRGIPPTQPPCLVFRLNESSAKLLKLLDRILWREIIAEMAINLYQSQ